MSSPVAQVVTPDMTDPNSTQLYINNLSFGTTQEALAAFFTTRIGVTPSEVTIVKNKSTAVHTCWVMVRAFVGHGPPC